MPEILTFMSTIKIFVLVGNRTTSLIDCIAWAANHLFKGLIRIYQSKSIQYKNTIQLKINKTEIKLIYKIYNSNFLYVITFINMYQYYWI